MQPFGHNLVVAYDASSPAFSEFQSLIIRLINNPRRQKNGERKSGMISNYIIRLFLSIFSILFYEKMVIPNTYSRTNFLNLSYAKQKREHHKFYYILE